MHSPVSILEEFMYVMCSTFNMVILYNLSLSTFEALKVFCKKERGRGKEKAVLKLPDEYPMNIFDTLL